MTRETTAAGKGSKKGRHTAVWMLEGYLVGRSEKREELYQAAIKAYERLCGREGYVQTSQTESSVGHKYVHLRNESGDYVAKYDHTAGVVVEVWLTGATQERETTVWVRRHPNKRQLAKCRLSDLKTLHLEDASEGEQDGGPQYLFGYVRCDQLLEGELPHSCFNGGAHSIGVCILKKDNPSAVMRQLIAKVGEQPNGDKNGN